ncbi:MAG: hypothetical protein JW983_01900 [Elusimicrobia bacterium]|nr:hypothetical protein [Elusimicrobiota bacterium]
MIEDIQIKEWYYKNRDHKKNEIVKILNVEYAHIILENKDDIYITKHGLPFIENLKPENFWTDEDWFLRNSVKLTGTSSLYRVRTKEVNGKYKDVVVKWNRMGQDIPVACYSDELTDAEFNSPFEEFSLVMELRNTVYESSEKIFIQKPLAVYVPSKTIELWQTGRKEYKMRSKIDTHKEIVLDINRSYAVIYEWIQGIDAAQAFKEGTLEEKYLEFLTMDSDEKIKKNGFVVKDKKPHHIIIRPKKGGSLARYKSGGILYGLVDFELLERTPEREKVVKKSKRADYLKRQKDRFNIEIPKKFHPHLNHIEIFGVDYVYGHVESTKGRLWVVGKDPYLFDYFLPEEWENTPKTKISVFSEMYHTVTKDNIYLVWKVSRLGMQPDMDPFKEDEKKILEYGYNSPFEEVSLAVELSGKGLPTIYPRAIYMTGSETEIANNLYDNSRYETHKNYTTPDGLPILKVNRSYIIIWGYWNGPDEKLAAKDGDYYEGINALRAYRDGIITQKEYITLLQVAREKLLKVKIEDLNLRGNHLLISFDSKGSLITDDHGIPEIRICNFEFLRRVKP